MHKTGFFDFNIENMILKYGKIFVFRVLTDLLNRHGIGKYTWADGSLYEGEWEDGLRHGQGIMTETDGRSYSGQWQRDKKHGYGIYKRPSGAVYEGQWEGDVIQGRGTFTDSGKN